MTRKRKKGKLLVQVGLVVTAIFIAIIATQTYVTFQSTVHGYLEAQNRYIVNTLPLIIGTTLDPEDEWYLSQWEANPELTLSPITEEESAAYHANYDPDRQEEQSLIMDGDWPEALRNYWIKIRYLFYKQFFWGYVGDPQIDDLFVIVVKEDGTGIIVAECTKDESDRDLGTQIDLKLSKHPAIRNILNGSREVEFERVGDFPRKGDNYVGYQPVYYNGSLRMVVGISYEWSSFRQSLKKNLIISLTIDFIGVVAACIIILLFLYRKSIRPVEFITKSVSDYTECKDSSKVIKDMSEIKTGNEFGVLSDRISGLAQEIDRYTGEIVKFAEEREKVAAELSLAARIQETNLPKRFESRSDFALSTFISPAKEVGGDFYDFFMIDDDHIGLTIADVSGKGIPAALIMMKAKIVIEGVAKSLRSPAEILKQANKLICENNDSSMFVTVWFGLYEFSTGRLIASNAGHEYPMIRQDGGKFRLLKDRHGIALGVIDWSEYEDYELTLQKGDVLFLYTDGAPEATRSDNTMFTTDRMLETLNSLPDDNPATVVSGMESGINSFVGDAPQFDDLTMLCIRRK